MTKKKSKSTAKKKPSLKKRPSPRKKSSPKKQKLKKKSVNLYGFNLNRSLEKYGYKINDLKSKLQIINYGSIFEGVYSSKDKHLLIFGEIHGNINCNNVTLTESAKVFGEIKTKNINVYGKCNASIKVKDNCVIKSSATLIGDIFYSNHLQIEPGAKILGNIKSNIKPLALPFYKNNLDSSKIIKKDQINNNIINDESLNVEKRKFEISKKENALDKIIKKIFN